MYAYVRECVYVYAMHIRVDMSVSLYTIFNIVLLLCAYLPCIFIALVYLILTVPVCILFTFMHCFIVNIVRILCHPQIRNDFNKDVYICVPPTAFILD